jgi:hypothetical protein
MSFQAMTWALEQQCGAPGPKLVLLCLANYADRHGACWPCIAEIADEAEMSLRSAKTHLATLKDLGLLDWEHRARPNGSRTSSMYQLAMPTSQSADSARANQSADSARGGCKICTGKRNQSFDPKEPRGGDLVSNPTSARDQDPPPDARSTPPARTTSTVEGTPPSPDIPPARCPEHINTPGDVPPCRACADARRAHDAAVKAHERARAARTALIDRDRHTNLQRQMIAAERAAYRLTKGQLRRLVRQHQAAASPQALADTALA